MVLLGAPLGARTGGLRGGRSGTMPTPEGTGWGRQRLRVGLRRAVIHLPRTQGDALVIRAEHRQEINQEGEEGPQEASYGRYERWVTLPPGTDRDKVEARYRNGVLEVRVPKTPEALGRKVEVK